MPPGCSLTSTTRASSAPAGADDAAARLEEIARPDSRTIGSTRGGIFRRRSARAAVVGDAQSAAEIQVIDREPVVAKVAGQRDERPGGAAQRLEVGDLRAHVAVQPDNLEAGAVAHPAADLAASSIAIPNLLFLRPVQMCGWLRGVDVGVDAHRDRARRCRATAIASIRSSSPSDSALMSADAEIDRLRQLGIRLADPGEHDLLAG